MMAFAYVVGIAGKKGLVNLSRFSVLSQAMALRRAPSGASRRRAGGVAEKRPPLKEASTGIIPLPTAPRDAAPPGPCPSQRSCPPCPSPLGFLSRSAWPVGGDLTGTDSTPLRRQTPRRAQPTLGLPKPRRRQTESCLPKPWFSRRHEWPPAPETSGRTAAPRKSAPASVRDWQALRRKATHPSNPLK